MENPITGPSRQEKRKDEIAGVRVGLSATDSLLGDIDKVLAEDPITGLGLVAIDKTDETLGTDTQTP